MNVLSFYRILKARIQKEKPFCSQKGLVLFFRLELMPCTYQAGFEPMVLHLPLPPERWNEWRVCATVPWSQSSFLNCMLFQLLLPSLFSFALEVEKKFWCWFQLQIGYNLKCTVTYLSWFCNVFVWTYAAPFVAQAVLEDTIFLTQPATYWDYRNGPPWLLPTQSLNFGFFLLCWGWNLGTCICYAIALFLSSTSGSWLFYTGTKWWGKNIKFPLEFNASARTA